MNLGSFRILLPFCRTSWGVGVLNSAIFKLIRMLELNTKYFPLNLQSGLTLSNFRDVGMGWVWTPKPDTPLQDSLYWKKPLFNKLQPYENTVNYKRKLRRRFFLFMRSRTPPISSEFRGGVWTPQTPPLGTPLSSASWEQTASPDRCYESDTIASTTAASHMTCNSVSTEFITLCQLSIEQWNMQITSKQAT